jgi:phosphatidylglycerol lysyltransferase
LAKTIAIKIFAICGAAFSKMRQLTNFLVSNPRITTFTTLFIFLLSLRLINKEINQFALEDIAIAFDDVRISNTLLAILGAIISYTALIMNDRFCLAMLGKQLIIWRTARASIACYSLAKTLGFSWAFASTARARFYSKWGLDNGEIGALSMSTGMAVQLGALSAAAFGLVIGAPEIARHGPFDAGFWWVLASISATPAIIWLYYCDVGTKNIKWGSATLKRPNSLTASLHLFIIIFDKIGAALCLYFLLPAHGGWEFPAFLAVFILAGLLGAISGAPGGLGVFEAAILTMAPNSQNVPGAAVALLVYRLIYNIVPMVAAIVFLGLHHAAPVAKPAARAAKKVGSLAIDIAPQILAILVFVCGYLLVIAAALPSQSARLIKLEAIFNPIFIDIFHFLTALIGVAMMLNSNFLWRESKGAFIWALVLVLWGAVLSLFKGISWEIAGVMTFILTLLLSARGEFIIEGEKLKKTYSYRVIAAIIGSLASIVWLSYFSFNQTPYNHNLWFETGVQAHVARAFRAVAGAIGFFCLAIFANWLVNNKSDEDELDNSLN